MKRTIRSGYHHHLLALMLFGFLAASPAFAEKPVFAGNGKSEEKAQGAPGKSNGATKDNTSPREVRHGKPAAARDSGDDGRRDGSKSGLSVHIGAYFGDSQRTIARNYYHEQFRAGGCPPGLAKKNNGCLPPGQAKKWALGKPLPRDVIYYSVPQGLVVQLGVPPSGHKYVRVAADILLIAIGTGMVIDAIQDLGSM